MPTSLPPSVREHFGEPVAEDFARWLEGTLQEQTVRRDERPDREGGSTPGVYREVLSRLDVIEERFEQMERRFDERFEEMQKRFDARLDQMQDQFEGHSKQVNKRLEGMDEKLDRMNDRILSMTRWLIGLIALLGTLVTALLAVAQFGG